MSSRHVVVVGGGIAGLTAALRLAESGVRVTVVEATARLGGKIQTAGDGIETGAEQFLMRTPDGGPSGAARLVADLGLSDRLVHPALGAAGLWVGGRLQSMPPGTLMGVPGFSAALDGVATLADDDRDLGVPVLAGQDVAVGELVRSRLGGEVVEHLVDPLLGGVYAGRADLLSLRATIPNLYAALQTAHTLRDGVAASLVKRSAGGPVFGTLRGGLSLLVEALSQRLLDLGVVVHYGSPLRSLDELDADAYVLACPAKPAAALLPAEVAERVSALDYASVGLVTLRLPGAELPELTGFLVPADQGLSIKAATFFSRKWEHLSGEPEAAVRVSVGRYGDIGALALTDEALGDAVQADLAKVLGPLPAASAVRVTRWGGALPQYAPGHVDRVAEARSLLAAGPKPVVLAGAAFDGVGIPICIASGEKAAADLGEFVS
ncbi:protoporphyrinogen oxidase [Hamadaea sp. NPDC050747]|uniref:protoporphyrinogen oxidase n=1 Tax=Hamadaea sp. NPDC050747 TaxID=3155789 RepID=UPI0033E62585